MFILEEEKKGFNNLKTLNYQFFLVYYVKTIIKKRSLNVEFEDLVFLYTKVPR